MVVTACINGPAIETEVRVEIDRGNTGKIEVEGRPYRPCSDANVVVVVLAVSRTEVVAIVVG